MSSTVDKRDVTDYIKFVKRTIRAIDKRGAELDGIHLRELIDLDSELHDTIRRVVGALRESGYTWDDIASSVGTTRQAAHSRWAYRLESEL